MLPGLRPCYLCRPSSAGVTVASIGANHGQVVLLGRSRALFTASGVSCWRGGRFPILIEQAARSGLPVLPTYGLTETAGQVATPRPRRPAREQGVTVARVKFCGSSLTAESRSEAWMVSPGYVGEPDAEPEEWLVTGDLGTIDEDGASGDQAGPTPSS